MYAASQLHPTTHSNVVRHQIFIINQLASTCKSVTIVDFAMASSHRNTVTPGPYLSKALHEKRGVNYASRFCVTEDSLPPGWQQEKKCAKYTVWYDDKGNRYKSRVEVK